MSNTLLTSQTYSKIQTASVMEADETLFKKISVMIDYRKKVAIDILSSKDVETTKNLINVYERSEFHIKRLLGV